MSLVNRVGKFIGKFIYGVINYFFGHERPSSEKILGEWVVVAEYSAEKIVTGIHGNEAKIGETTICVEQNTCSGRLRGVSW